MKWQPVYEITPNIIHNLKRIEDIQEKATLLSIDDHLLTSLREDIRCCTVYHSTVIENYTLEPNQIREVIKNKNSTPSDRTVKEIKGYYSALLQIEQWAEDSTPISEKAIQLLHATIISGGELPINPSPYREKQNIIYNDRTHAIAYMPPEPGNVSSLIKQLVKWIQKNERLPSPIVAAITHHQLISIHPYYHANGRISRLMASLVLYICNKHLRGLYSLENYYTSNLNNYFNAIYISPSHNYYNGRSKAEITPWIQYFVERVALSFEEAYKRILEIHSQGFSDQTTLIQKLEPKQRKAVNTFLEFNTVEIGHIQKT